MNYVTFRGQVLYLINQAQLAIVPPRDDVPRIGEMWSISRGSYNDERSMSSFIDYILFTNMQLKQAVVSKGQMKLLHNLFIWKVGQEFSTHEAFLPHALGESHEFDSFCTNSGRCFCWKCCTALLRIRVVYLYYGIPMDMKMKLLNRWL
jgi:hypothetical protein